MTQHDMEIEDALVEKLRCRMKGHMKKAIYEDDHFFKRFLRARNLNIDAAETMLKNHINWRNHNKVDTILDDYIPQKFLTSEYITLSRLGADLEGAPLSYLHIGHLDTKGMLKAVKSHDIQQYIVHHLETDIAAMKKYGEETGHFVHKCVFIFNFESFSLTSATHKQTLELFLGIVSMYEANFPETLKRAYVINVSYYFFLLWAVLKPFLCVETEKKIKIFGKGGWQEELLKDISPDVLPEFLGGSRTDPDGNPMCKTMIRFGGTVPETFFEYSNQSFAARISGAKKLTVSRMSKAEVKLQVLHPGSTLEWEFVVKHRDIGFRVLYREDKALYSDAGDKVVIPLQRIETSKATESGMYQCKKSGKYIIEFDNTYSWMFGKEIYYTSVVTAPHAQVS